MFKIYYLEENGIPFYLGKAKNIVRRKHRHYITYGTNIKLEVIDEVEDWRFWEEFYIWLFLSWGFELKNKNKGGGGPTQYTEEQKQSMRKSRKKGTGKKISKTLIERNHSKYYTQEIKDKMSKNAKGSHGGPFTKTHLMNLAKANLESKGKIVECYDLQNKFIKNFPCLREAKNWLLTKNPLISNNADKQIKDCCNGRQKTCHGYKFKYK